MITVLRITYVVALSFFFVHRASGQDSVVAGPSIEPIAISYDSISAAIEEPASPAAAFIVDSITAEQEVAAYEYVHNQLAYRVDPYEVPSEIGKYVHDISPKYRHKLYDKYNKTASLLLALINFFPIPFLGTALLGDEFGGYILLGALILATIAIMGKVSQCTDCQTTANIMLYTAAGVGIWIALRPFYLYKKNSEYNKLLASALQPPSISFITVQPILQHTMAGVVVPTLQLAIGF